MCAREERKPGRRRQPLFCRRISRKQKALLKSAPASPQPPPLLNPTPKWREKGCGQQDGWVGRPEIGQKKEGGWWSSIWWPGQFVQRLAFGGQTSRQTPCERETCVCVGGGTWRFQFHHRVAHKILKAKYFSQHLISAIAQKYIPLCLKREKT